MKKMVSLSPNETKKKKRKKKRKKNYFHCKQLLIMVNTVPFSTFIVICFKHVCFWVNRVLFKSYMCSVRITSLCIYIIMNE